LLSCSLIYPNKLIIKYSYPNNNSYHYNNNHSNTHQNINTNTYNWYDYNNFGWWVCRRINKCLLYCNRKYTSFS